MVCGGGFPLKADNSFVVCFVQEQEQSSPTMPGKLHNVFSVSTMQKSLRNLYTQMYFCIIHPRLIRIHFILLLVPSNFTAFQLAQTFSYCGDGKKIFFPVLF